MLRLLLNNKKTRWTGVLFCTIFITLAHANERLWVTGYLPSYHQASTGAITFLTEKDYQKLTHLSHHGPYVNPDASFNYEPTSFSNLKAEKAVVEAHRHGVPILLCVVAWYDQYKEAIKDSLRRTTLINNTLRLVDQKGYDGVDLDLEPVMSAYIPGIAYNNLNYIQFARQLYDSLQTRRSRLLGGPLLLTAAMNGYAGPVFAALYDQFDQINIMTYDLAAPDWGFPVWHDSAVYSGGYMISGRPAPSVQGEVQKCLLAGVPSEKLGIGVICDAFRWQGGAGTTTGGATAPKQQWTKAPSWTRFAYKDMMATCYRQEYYRWDDAAKMSYLSIDREGSANDEFWSYNDDKSCQAKVEFIKGNGLGGLIIWELGSGYLASRPPGERLPQLSAIHEAVIQSSNVAENDKLIPLRSSLFQNYPNPFNTSTTIEYNLEKDSHVCVAVFNDRGQHLETLADEKQASGQHKIFWVEKRTCGKHLPSGVYFCRLAVDGVCAVRKMILLQ